MLIDNVKQETQTAAKGALVVRLCNWVGEVVLSVPAIRRLESAGFELHLVGKPWAPALLEGTGWPVLVRESRMVAAIRQLHNLEARLTSRHAAPKLPALLMTRSLSSALETRLAGLSPAGYAYDGRTLLLSRAFAYPKFEHASHAYWRLVSNFLGTDSPYPKDVGLCPSRRQALEADRLMAAHGLTPSAFLVICPFSGPDDHEGRKVWPGFPALVEVLRARAIRVIACPGPGEETRLAALPGVTAFTGVDLGVYAALLAKARCVIANDTGPGHIAAAVGTRLVSIFGPRSTVAWAPLSSNLVQMNEGAWPSFERVVAAALG